MIDYAYVIRHKGGRYLANRFYRMTSTQTLIRAKTFLTRDVAEKAAEVHGGEVVLIQIREV